jgi:hypothetical protein
VWFGGELRSACLEYIQERTCTKDNAPGFLDHVPSPDHAERVEYRVYTCAPSCITIPWLELIVFIVIASHLHPTVDWIC